MKQLGQLDKAASAAHTYFQANPEHVEMGEDLEQYKAQKGVKEEHFIDRESRPHQVSDCRHQLLVMHRNLFFTEVFFYPKYESKMKCYFIVNAQRTTEFINNELHLNSTFLLIYKSVVEI